jgi:predicted ribosomally synthesized peptide with nif11-like leader
MSEEQFKAFQEAVQADAGLQEKLKTAGDADSVVAIAKAAGFVISAEELEAAASAQVGNLSDEDLESVTGGAALGYTNYCTVYTCKPKCSGG